MTDQLANTSVVQSATQSEATTAASNGDVALYAYHNTNPAPHNQGHIGTLSVGENVAKGEAANIGANNGFMPIGPGKGSVFTQQKTLDQADFYILSPTVAPKTAPQYIPIGKYNLGQ